MRSNELSVGKPLIGDLTMAEINESGGLLSLRTLVERESGTMQVESFPEFRLAIRLDSVGNEVFSDRISRQRNFCSHWIRRCVPK